MATWSPISNTVPQYHDAGVAASGFYLKFYRSGTTTATEMATDSAGGTTLDKCEINSEGYPVNGSSDVFIPHIDRSYKLVLYRNATDADSDTTANAAWEVDGLSPVTTSGDGVGSVDSVAALIAGSWSQDNLYVTSYYAGWAATVAGPKGGQHIHKTGATNAAPTVGSPVAVSTIGTGSQAGYYWDASGSEFVISFDLLDKITPYKLGAYGDDATDDTTALTDWLYIAYNHDLRPWLPCGTFLCDEIDMAINDGLSIDGTGTIKATGSNRLRLIRFTGVRGPLEIDGITIDGNNICARPLDIQNTNSTSSTLGSCYIGTKFKLARARNNTPDTYTALGVYVQGGFTDVVFEGEIDGVEDTRTAGAVAVGFNATWSATAADDWIRNTVITSKSRIRNVKNSNTVLADADGVSAQAPTTVIANFTVASGALFEECEGRAIKSQMVGNSIDSPVIRRAAYDGLNEIDLQYAGGHVRGAKIFHDGTRVNSVISCTQRTSPANTQCSMSENELTVTGTPASNTGNMISTDVTDAAVKLQGVTVRDNKVKGTVDNVVACRVANTVDVNRIIVDGNWADTVSNAFVKSTLYGSSRAQLSIVFTNNGAENACTGSDITDDLIVEYERGNHNITDLLSNPFSLTIDTGAITVYGRSHRVDTESSASTDDLDTINGVANRSHDEILILYANNSARSVVVKDSTGNIKLAGADFTMDNVEDRLVLTPDGLGNWVELSRSDNGA